MIGDRAPDFGRRDTILRALRRLYGLHPGPARLLETGTLRNDEESHRSAEGWSTIAWGWYCAQTGGSLHTVDIDPAALDVARRMTGDYAAHIDYVAADSLEFLRRWREEGRGPVHLLYLDSYDWFTRDGNCERHHLAEAVLALPLLADTALVLIDDTYPIGEGDGPVPGVPMFEGKGALAVPYLASLGLAVEWHEGGQVLLSRGAAKPPPEEH